MKRFGLRQLVFLTLCCDLGLFGKRLLAPAANVITEALHIPGGVSAGFSLMFLAVGAAVVDRPGCAAVMGAVQSVLALCFGMVGSMGALSPIGYILPGVVLDLVLLATRRSPLGLGERVMGANALAAVAASLTANAIVFRLRGPILLLYLCVSCTCGAIWGLAGGQAALRVRRAVFPEKKERSGKDEE